MKILIVDNEDDLVEVVSLTFRLQWPGVEVVSASNGQEALDQFLAEAPGVVILDIGIPELDGYEVCRQIRAVSDVPIIMLTVHDEELDKVRGLEAGADDYVTKPFGHLELLARVRAVLRRTRPSGSVDSGLLRVGDLAIDFARREVTRAGERVSLTPTEYSLLVQLARNADQIQTHDGLLRRVWGPEYVQERDYLKAYVKRLRQRIEADPAHPRHILTERGIGYRFSTR
jgi:two-component system, OmpR family, KDP operon response regulator KdpE